MAKALGKSDKRLEPSGPAKEAFLIKLPQISPFSLMLRTFWFVNSKMKLESKFYGGPL